MQTIIHPITLILLTVTLCVGFIGILVILKPGFGIFSQMAIVPLAAALLFAIYGILTRYVAKLDSAATSFFWTGVVGAIAITLVGINFWQPMTAGNWGWMALLCVTGAMGHYLLIKCYEVAQANTVQPFAYLQLVWASGLGIFIFGETLHLNVIIGAIIVVAAGLFTLWRERQVR